jgi:hypothetical protein
VTLAQPPAVAPYHPPDMFTGEERPEWCSPALPERAPDRPPVYDDPPPWSPPGGSYHNVRWTPDWTPDDLF